MYKEKKILALIPARGGSKGIKNKNIIEIEGKPLIAYTIESALKSKYIDSIVVSTDSYEIAETSRKYGARIPFMRPEELARDTSKTIDAVYYTARRLQKQGEVYDAIVLLQATQPLRIADDIDGAIEHYYNMGEKSLLSVSETEVNPILIRTIDEKGVMEKILDVSSTCRRQDMPKYYRVNGCIYINSVQELDTDTSFNDNEMPYIMPKERAVDIDEMVDIAMVEYYLKEGEQYNA